MRRRRPFSDSIAAVFAMQTSNVMTQQGEVKYQPAFPTASYDRQGFCLKHPMILVRADSNSPFVACPLCSAGGGGVTGVTTSDASKRNGRTANARGSSSSRGGRSVYANTPSSHDERQRNSIRLAATSLSPEQDKRRQPRQRIPQTYNVNRDSSPWAKSRDRASLSERRNSLKITNTRLDVSSSRSHSVSRRGKLSSSATSPEPHCSRTAVTTGKYSIENNSRDHAASDWSRGRELRTSRRSTTSHTNATTLDTGASKESSPSNQGAASKWLSNCKTRLNSTADRARSRSRQRSMENGDDSSKGISVDQRGQSSTTTLKDYRLNHTERIANLRKSVLSDRDNSKPLRSHSSSKLSAATTSHRSRNTAVSRRSRSTTTRRSPSATPSRSPSAATSRNIRRSPSTAVSRRRSRSTTTARRRGRSAGTTATIGTKSTYSSRAPSRERSMEENTKYMEEIERQCQDIVDKNLQNVQIVVPRTGRSVGTTVGTTATIGTKSTYSRALSKERSMEENTKHIEEIKRQSSGSKEGCLSSSPPSHYGHRKTTPAPRITDTRNFTKKQLGEQKLAWQLQTSSRRMERLKSRRAENDALVKQRRSSASKNIAGNSMGASSRERRLLSRGAGSTRGAEGAARRARGEAREGSTGRAPCTRRYREERRPASTRQRSSQYLPADASGHDRKNYSRDVALLPPRT